MRILLIALLSLTLLLGCKSEDDSSTAAPVAPEITVDEAGDSQVTIGWASVSDADSYNLRYTEDSTFASNITTVAGLRNTSYTVEGLTNGVTYYFDLNAEGAGGSSNYSNTVEAIPLSPAEGTWMTSCENSGVISTLVVSGTEMTLTHVIYLDTACTTNNKQETHRLTFDSFAITYDIVTVNNTDGYHLGYNLLSYSIELQDVGTVNTHNTNTTCGINDWAIQTPRDVMGTGCDNVTSKDVIAPNTANLRMGDVSTTRVNGYPSGWQNTFYIQ